MRTCNMNDQREAKRARQACIPCRRKKTRCSGEKPVCAFCARLKQDCRWDDSSMCDHSHIMPNAVQDANLAARVALLESKLSLLNGDPADSASFPVDHHADTLSRKRRTSTRDQASVSEGSPNSQMGSETSRRPAQLPPEGMIRSVLQTYFIHCHNQPYAFFRPEYFYWKFNRGEVPDYLLMAMLALAARFSSEPFFESKNVEAIETYSRTAWNEIFEKSFSEDFNLDIHAVQATNLLAIVDFTDGRTKLGWQKVGLAVRFAQSLQLGADVNADITAEERDERFLTFWSTYILDRLVSCSSHRAPTISDSDIALQLPSDTPRTDEVGSPLVPVLRTLSDFSTGAADQILDYFAQTVLMASALGRVQRHILQHRGSTDPFPPWDSRSDFANINSMLLNFEAQSDITRLSFSTTIAQFVSPDGTRDHPGAGHLIFANMLYHMNQCLLHHPFLLRKRLEACKAKVSLTFRGEALRRGLEHANQLTVVLRTAQKQGFTIGSFFSYAMIVAGTIHKLFTHHENEWTRHTAQQLYEQSVGFFDGGKATWNHFIPIATSLKTFEPDPASARDLVSSSTADNYVPNPTLDVLWKLLDYGWLSDAARPSMQRESAEPRPSLPTQDQGLWESGGAAALLEEPRTANGTSNIEDRSFDLLEDFDPGKPLAIHGEVSTDFMGLPDALGDPWPQLLGPGDFFSPDLQILSPWSQQVER
ncbi:fungal-specific transcription factor domain-containing protein [Exophiala viscosa]|uniref:Fungal-specific transcription factor domain-containing protein n=1 Tax=Exophiala viscosa TaxID=2486360 RepID=A0AAN6IHZ3_9EURO|nr:fungal-specific transcription factor domain-containing protein [Exophiala viscosa]